MPVRAKYKLTGTSDAEATEYGIVYVAKDPVTGLAHVADPDTLSNGKKVIPGCHPTINEKRIIWDEDADPIKVVIFEYEPDAAPGALSAEAIVAQHAAASMPGKDPAYGGSNGGSAKVYADIKKAIDDALGNSSITVTVVSGSTTGLKYPTNGVTKDDEGMTAMPASRSLLPRVVTLGLSTTMSSS